jgi:methyltransferase (TIGR00027 family)
MIEARPSTTAHRVAMRRAAHQLFDHPLILDDPIALPILGEETRARLRAEEREARGRAQASFRAFMVVRSRFAEDELKAAVPRGASQYVILGAGLDTFAYRNPYSPAQLRVFEVDHPATQAWKRKRLADGHVVVPPAEALAYVAVDFETQSLAGELAKAGFDPGRVTFFAWLGVTPYLTKPAMDSTLGFIASCAKGSGVVFDYVCEKRQMGILGRLAFERLAQRVAMAGEPFTLLFDPKTLIAEMRGMGFSHFEDLGGAQLNDRYFAGRTDNLRVLGRVGRIMSART